MVLLKVLTRSKEEIEQTELKRISNEESTLKLIKFYYVNVFET